MHERGLLRHDPQRVGAAQLLAALVDHAQRAAALIPDAQIFHRCSKPSRREAHACGQAVDRPVGLQPQRAIDQIGWITPLVVGLDRQAERLARSDQRRQHGAPVHPRPRHDGNLRVLRQRDVIVGGDGIGEHSELELAFAIGLHANAGRALATIAEADRDGVAGRQEVLHHADVERAAPRADVALELPLRLEGGAVGGLNCGVALALRIGELHRPEVGGEPEADLDRAGVVEAEGAGGIDQRKALQRARLEASRGGQRRRAHQVGTVVGVGHWESAAGSVA